MFDELKDNMRNLDGLLTIMINWIESRKKDLQREKEVKS